MAKVGAPRITSPSELKKRWQALPPPLRRRLGRLYGFFITLQSGGLGGDFFKACLSVKTRGGPFLFVGSGRQTTDPVTACRLGLEEGGIGSS